MHSNLLTAGSADQDHAQRTKDVELFSSNTGREKRSLLESGAWQTGRDVIIWKECMALISKRFRSGRRSAHGTPRGAGVRHRVLQWLIGIATESEAISHS